MSERNTREIYCNAQTLHRVKELASASSVPAIGTIAAINASGKAVPAGDTAGLIVIGRVDAYTCNNKMIAKSGVFIFNSGTTTEALTAADINKTVYIVDDHTVGKVGGTNKIPCGILRDVISATEVIVEIGNLQLS